MNPFRDIFPPKIVYLVFLNRMKKITNSHTRMIQRTASLIFLIQRSKYSLSWLNVVSEDPEKVPMREHREVLRENEELKRRIDGEVAEMRREWEDLKRSRDLGRPL
jgi:hypothetical protein